MTIETARRASLEFVCVFGQDAVANTKTKLLIYGLSQKGRVLAQDGVLSSFVFLDTTGIGCERTRWRPEQ